MGNRPEIQESLRQALLYESAFACVVCQDRRVQIHHIDQNNRNNKPRNLVVLCHNHHDDAHTTKSLSQNLTPARLRAFKGAWIRKVELQRKQIVSLAGQLAAADAWSSVGVTWAYINHRRVAQLVDRAVLRSVDRDVLQRCVTRKVVDKSGLILKPVGLKPAGSYIKNTIYDWFPFGDDHALHKLYSSFVDQIAKRAKPIHLDRSSWTKTFIGNCLQEGQLIFFTKAMYFRRVSEGIQNAHLRVTTRQNRISIEYYVDTRDMFGTTSISVSFSGHKSCSSLLQIKSITKAPRGWTVHCTPIALGVGFRAAL